MDVLYDMLSSLSLYVLLQRWIDFTGRVTDLTVPLHMGAFSVQEVSFLLISQ